LIALSDLQFQTPTGIDIDREGYVYVVNNHGRKISKFTLEGDFIVNIARGGGTANGRFVEPHDVAVDVDGRVYVTDSGNNRIQVFEITDTITAVTTTPTVKVSYKKGLKRGTGSDVRKPNPVREKIKNKKEQKEQI